MMKNKIMVIIFIVLLITILFVIYFLYLFNFLPHKMYSNRDFHIETYISNVDKDYDGVDDQTDILNSVRDYIATNPKYKSKYYGTGYPDDEYGVCTDVVAFALLHSGYDIMTLLNEDVMEVHDAYDIDIVDKNIDFRRVNNLDTYFKRHMISLSTDLSNISDWQGGDIIVFDGHIGIVSDKRNFKGIPFLLHNANPYQICYEEDVLEKYTIIGHYRVS